MIAFRILVVLFSGISIMISANTPGDITGLTLCTLLHFLCVLNFKMIYITWVLNFFFLNDEFLFPSSFKFSEKKFFAKPSGEEPI